MNFEMMHPADQIVALMERIYGYGMTTTSGGNLSILDDNGDIWITPGGVDKGSLTRDDIMCIKPDGTMIGRHRPSVEYPFHSMVYKKRPDVKAVLHAHPPALVAFSIARKIPNTNLIPNANIICGNVVMAEYDLPGSLKLGEKVAEKFTDGIKTIMLENHGVVVADTDLFKAFMAFETLEYCARLEINANQIGEIKPLSPKCLNASKKKNHADMQDYEPTSYTSYEKQERAAMCRLIARSYQQRLFTSTQGTFSQRIDGNNFIITPYGIDRKYLKPEDLVRIEDGKKEKGKTPSRSALLHQIIYEKNPDVNSIIVAHPHNVMAFAVTDAQIDSRTIPESYIMMRDVKKLPFGSSFMQPQMTAEEINLSTPVLLVENDCLIVIGTSLINAFDRLEVCEYSAKAIIAAKHIGEIIKINEEQVEEINVAFNLN